MKRIVYVLFGWLVFQFGCDVNQLEFDNVEMPTVQSLVALPIGELSYTLRELIDSLGDVGVTIEEDPETTLLSLVYTDTITYTASNADFVDIGDITDDFVIDLPETPPSATAATVTIDTLMRLEYPAQGEELLDSVVYVTADLTLVLNSGVGNITYTASIHSTTTPGGASTTFRGTLPENATQNIDGYSTALTNENGINYFEVELHMEITLAPGESIGAGETVAGSLSYTNQTFESLFGYFGNDTISVGSINFAVDFFESLGGNNAIEFKGPEINLNFTNPVGLPIGIRFNEVYGISTDSTTGQSDTTFMTGSAVSTPQLVASPTVDQIGESVQSTISLNRNNSNLNEIFGNTPNELNFTISGITNPFDNTARNFFIPNGNNTIQAIVEIRLPMEMKLTNLTREISLDINTNLKIDEVDSAVLRIVTLNLLPFSTKMDIEFLDENDSVTHTVDQTLVMATPFININFVANEAEPNVADIPLSRAGIDALIEAKKINLVLTLNTPETLNSRDIYPLWLARYDLTVKVSTLVKLNVKL